MNSAKAINLYEAKKRGRLFVSSVPNVKLLENMGVRAGTQVTVQNRYAFGGPVLLRVEDAYSIALGKDLAKQISVIKGSKDKGETLSASAPIESSEKILGTRSREVAV
ncbi:MAG: ferrous iron transport protein A [Oscillospiraceae bacterium]|nr:ferrous iron transport protein A [Oscillospiraceae bacterium]